MEAKSKWGTPPKGGRLNPKKKENVELPPTLKDLSPNHLEFVLDLARMANFDPQGKPYRTPKGVRPNDVAAGFCGALALLRDHGELGEETAQTIRELAGELGAALMVARECGLVKDSDHFKMKDSDKIN